MYTTLVNKVSKATLPVGSVEVMRASFLVAVVRGLRRNIGVLKKG